MPPWGIWQGLETRLKATSRQGSWQLEVRDAACRTAPPQRVIQPQMPTAPRPGDPSKWWPLLDRHLLPSCTGLLTTASDDVPFCHCGPTPSISSSADPVSTAWESQPRVPGRVGVAPTWPVESAQSTSHCEMHLLSPAQNSATP